MADKIPLEAAMDAVMHEFEKDGHLSQLKLSYRNGITVEVKSTKRARRNP